MWAIAAVGTEQKKVSGAKMEVVGVKHLES